MHIKQAQLGESTQQFQQRNGRPNTNHESVQRQFADNRKTAQQQRKIQRQLNQQASSKSMKIPEAAVTPTASSRKHASPIQAKFSIGGTPSKIVQRAPIQKVIIAPPTSKLDVIGIMSIMQMLRNGVDDKVVGYELVEKGLVDLSKEKAIRFKGHGAEDGSYANGISGAELGVALLKSHLPQDVYIGLDYCYSAGMLDQLQSVLLKAQVSHKLSGNKNVSVTQDDGVNYSKAQKTGYSSHQEEVQKQFSEVCKAITADSRWETVEGHAKNLKTALKFLNSKLTIPLYTNVIRFYGNKIFKDIIPIYQALYGLNEELIDPHGRKTKRAIRKDSVFLEHGMGTIPENGLYDTKALKDDRVIASMLAQGVSRRRAWAVRFAEMHKYDEQAMVAEARKFNLRFHVVGGEVHLRIRGG